MDVYFTIKSGKMIITRHAFKAQCGIGMDTPVHKFSLPIEKEYVENRQLLYLLKNAYETDSVVERNLMLSNILLNIKNFDNKKFTKYITDLWIESVHTLSSCLFAEKQILVKTSDLERPKLPRKNIKKLLTKKKIY